MFKRGQVTAFIVIGLVFLLIFGILLYFGYSIGTKQTDAKLEGMQKFSANALKVRPYVENCIRQQTIAALFLASKQNPEQLPDLAELETSIENYLKENLALCADFRIFKEFDITTGEISAKVDILSDNFAAKITWPITVKQSDLNIVEKDFIVEFPLQLNDLYIKVKNIADSRGIDLNTILEQDINIEITGCENGRINYIINDNDYSIDGNALQFFFNTKIENLGEIFSFKENIRYLPKTYAGKQILRRQNDAKRLLFETTKDNIVKGCYEDGDRKIGVGTIENGGANGSGATMRINETERYTFGLVDDNVVKALASVKEAKTIFIRKNDQLKDTTSLNNTKNTIFDSIFEFSSGSSFKNITIILKKSQDFIIPNPSIYKLTPLGWNSLETDSEGDYYFTNSDELGTFSLGSNICVRDLLNETNFNILFVPLNYNNLTEFSSHVEKHKEVLINGPLKDFKDKVGFNTLFVQNNYSCLSINDCNITTVKEMATYCDTDINYLIGLIDSTVIGLDHTTFENVSIIGSYLTLDSQYCATCNTKTEFLKFLGLNDNSTQTDIGRRVGELVG